MMHASAATVSVLRSKEYLFEPKLDGYRALCEVKNGKAVFRSRNNLLIPFAGAVKTRADCILDGEIISYDRKGNPSFALMQQGSAATYVAFDIIGLAGT